MNPFYDSDGSNTKSPLLHSKRPNLQPSPSPPPDIPARFLEALPQSPNSTPNNVSKLPSSKRRKRPNRQKTIASKADSFLIRAIAPEHPEIAQFAGHTTLNSDSGSEEDAESVTDTEEAEDMPTVAASDMDLSKLAQDALEVAKGSAMMENHNQEVIPERGSSSLGILRDSKLEDVTAWSESSPLPRHNGSPLSGEAFDVENSNITGTTSDFTANLHALKSNDFLSKASQSTIPNLGTEIEQVVDGQDKIIIETQSSLTQTLPSNQVSTQRQSSISPNADVNLNQLAEAATKGLNHQSEGTSGTTTVKAPTPRAPQAHSSSPIQFPQEHQSHFFLRDEQPSSQLPSPTKFPTNLAPLVKPYDPTTLQDYRDPGRELPNLSPPAGPGNSGAHPYYFNRRASHNSEHGPPFTPAKSGESPFVNGAIGQKYSSAEPFSPSTADSDPGDQRMSIDEEPVTATQQGNPQTVGVFRCDFPGCLANPFHTQYLLNSHANVHSSIRPHCCPVMGCPRGEGGTGFKRKNEMIRHGLVHASPGYICPFCPARDHRYPRPDNLLRHVKAHHRDKDRDDQLLRDVLGQRIEGGSRGRRRIPR